MSAGDGLGEQWWRDSLTGRNKRLRWGRAFLRHLPGPPRCKLCAAPFGGAGGVLMRAVGKRPWPRNPKYCSSCFRNMEMARGGTELECTLLFADVRGSTAMAEGMRPSEMRALMDRFFATASRILVEHDGIVDKFVGDEVIGIFVSGLGGERHAARAIAAARTLLAATGVAGGGPRLPVGAGVHTGVAFVGTVGELPKLELTAMGDAVNVAARLASVAGADEILVSLAAARAATLIEDGLERRDLELKGKSEPTPVLVLGA